MQSGNHYEVLGVSSTANSAEIRKAYHRLALLHHPDTNPGDSLAAERFRRIAEAYSVLADSGLRAAYDLRFSQNNFDDNLMNLHYLEVEIETDRIKLNEELSITYSFPSDGRAFKKPFFTGWEITFGPTVEHRNNLRNGYSVRETVLHYTLSPLQPGRLEIPAASIHFQQGREFSASLSVQVEENDCYFAKGQQAGFKPLRIELHRIAEVRYSNFRKMVVHRRTVLVPRSELAAWYHSIGKMMKTVFPFIGMGCCLIIEYPLMVGFFAGSLFAGINVHLMYRWMGIRPAFRYAESYPPLKEYYHLGYDPGPDPPSGIPGSKQWRYLRSLLS